MSERGDKFGAVIGYAIYAYPKKITSRWTAEPLGYALHGQPFEELLLKRGYVCVFPSKVAAREALAKSLEKDNTEWHREHEFQFMPVREVV